MRWDTEGCLVVVPRIRWYDYDGMDYEHIPD